MCFSAPCHQSSHSIFLLCGSSVLLVLYISILLFLQSEKEKKYTKWRNEEAEWRAGDGSSGGGDMGRGLQSSHQWAAMTGCHSCQGLWEIFCQGKANSSSFSPNRPVRPSERGGDVVSLELRALFETAALRLPHATCNKGPLSETQKPTQRTYDRLHCKASAAVWGCCVGVENSPRPAVCLVLCNF